MNYRHIFHAGNFADVVKHCLLMSLIKSFFKKEKAFFYLDTHAGNYIYNLRHPNAQKTKEYLQGIVKIYNQKNAPEAIQEFLAIVKSCEESFAGNVHYYPGSTYIARQLLRPQDRMAITELSVLDSKAFQAVFKQDKQVAVHHMDGYAALNALLPPKERRGLVFIDPTYEHINEQEQILTSLNKALNKWPNGIYALWYPIKSHIDNELFLKAVKNSFNFTLLTVELNIYPIDAPLSLNGTGFLIINPPWEIEKTFETYLSWLWQKLSINKQGDFRILKL